MQVELAASLLQAVHDPQCSRSQAQEAGGGDFREWPFEAKLIVQAVSWCLCYPLSYRGIEEMLLERAPEVDHSTINRWVLASPH